MIALQEVIAFIQAALECSVYVAPLEPGLSHEEILEVSKRAGFQEGEVNDALPRAAKVFFGGGRISPNTDHTHWAIFVWPEEPEFRNIKAFDFVYQEFNKLIRSEGAARAKLERSVLVERAIAQSIDRNDVQVAISIMVLTNQLAEKDKLLWRPSGMVYQPLPSEQRNSTAVIRRPHRARAFPFVKDVIERRHDRRPKRSEPFDAFAEVLTTLGYGQFRLWWTQTVAELSRSDAASFPVSICILAATLVEGALTFVVKHAQGRNLGVLGSKTFEGDPRTWKIDELIASASKGRDSAILNDSDRARADRLVRLRQRIHAGRMLSAFPGGPPDLRPEEAREARESAEIIVRAVLDWLERHP